MSKITIPWDDGSGDNLYIESTGQPGNNELPITSDFNDTGFERRKTLIFKTQSNGKLPSEAYLTVIQKTDNLIVAIYDNIGSSYGD